LAFFGLVVSFVGGARLAFGDAIAVGAFDVAAAVPRFAAGFRKQLTSFLLVRAVRNRTLLLVVANPS
jgi:hypothetical protein